jgi:hypothetical protein
MDVTQVATLVNSVNSEIIGSSAILEEDLSNVVDVGKAVFDATSYDKYVKALVDHIGKVIFVDRKYSGELMALYRDNWEYGAVMEKIYVTELPTAIENDTWKLTNGTSYDPNVFTQPSVAAKFYNKKTTFEVDLSIADIQVRSAFDSATQLNAFISMLMNSVDTAINIRLEGLAERVVNTLIANTVYDDISDGDYTKTGAKAINLLKLYNDQFDPNGSNPLLKNDALYNAEFIRFASLVMAKTLDRIKKPSVLFNCGGLVRHTPKDMQHFILLSDFKRAADVYLQSETFHDEYTALPLSDSVAYWQGSGTDYGFDSISKIHMDIVDPADDTKTVEVEIDGVIGVAFDHWAGGITNDKRRVTSNYNPKGEFTNMFYKQDANYFVDLNENCVVFFIGDDAGE